VAHAFVVAGRRTAGAARVASLLQRGVRRGGALYWAGDRSSRLGGSESVDVEMTAYMVLSLLKLGGTANLGEAALAVKWLNTKRNGRGGFVSSQDTVVALTALTEFAVGTYSPDVAVTVTASAGGGFREVVRVDGGTRLLTRQKRLPAPLTLPDTVRFSVTGKGCALVQSVFRYSTKTAFPDPAFNLKASISKTKCTGSRHFDLRVCTSFKNPNVESNMAIVEIETISGHVVITKSLDDLVKNGVVRRAEQKNGKASLYFDEFSTKEVCFSISQIQATKVEKLKPAVVSVYDYYDPKNNRFEVEYGPPYKAC